MGRAKRPKGDSAVLDTDLDPAPLESDVPASNGKGAKKAKTSRKDKEPATPVTDPRVDLLSGWAQDIVRTAKYRNRLISAGIALAVAVALTFIGQQLRLFEARAEMRGEEQVGTQLTSQIRELKPVESYMGDVESRAEIIETTMLTEVTFSSLLRELDRVAPGGVDIETVTIAMRTPDPEDEPDPDDPSRGIFETCNGPDPFRADISIGCIQIGGTAADRETVADLIVGLDASDLFTEPFVQTTSTSPDEPVEFSGIVGVAVTAFSGRFDGVVEAFEKALDPDRGSDRDDEGADQ